MPRGRLRKIIIRASVVLLLGAIVNVAVAWGCALSLDSGPQDYGVAELPEGDDALVHLLAGGSVSLVVHTRCMPTGVIWSDLFVDVWRNEVPLPRWANMRLSDALREEVYCWHIAWGWPMLSLRCRFDYRIESDLRWSESRRYAIAVPAVFGVDDSNVLPVVQTNRSMPLRPIWPGFAINTMFYAAILWMLFAAPFALRKRRRIKRGLCPACAYPVGASERCTECGQCLIAARRWR